MTKNVVFVGTDRNDGWSSSNLFNLCSSRGRYNSMSMSPYCIKRDFRDYDCEYISKASEDRKKQIEDEVIEFRKQWLVDKGAKVRKYQHYLNQSIKDCNYNITDIENYDIDGIMEVWEKHWKETAQKPYLYVTDGYMLYKLLSNEKYSSVLNMGCIILAGTNRYDANQDVVSYDNVYYGMEYSISLMLILMIRLKGRDSILDSKLYNTLIENPNLYKANPYLTLALLSCGKAKVDVKKTIATIWKEVRMDDTTDTLLALMLECVNNGVISRKDLNDIIFKSTSIKNHKKVSNLYRKIKDYIKPAISPSITDFFEFIKRDNVYIGFELIINDIMDEELQELDPSVIYSSKGVNNIPKGKLQSIIDIINKTKESNITNDDKIIQYVISESTDSSGFNTNYKCLFLMIDMLDKEVVEQQKNSLATAVLNWVLYGRNFTMYEKLPIIDKEKHEIVAKEVFCILNKMDARQIRTVIGYCNRRDNCKGYDSFGISPYTDLDLCDISNKKIYKIMTEMSI